MASCGRSTTAISKLELPVGVIHHHKCSSQPLLSFKGRRFSIPARRRITGLNISGRNAFRVVSSLVDKLSVDEGAEASQTRTSTWNWRGYSIRYQCAGTGGTALVLIHGFGANRSTLLQFRFSSTI